MLTLSQINIAKNNSNEEHIIESLFENANKSIMISNAKEDENGDYNNQDNDKTNHINNNINQQFV